jgi:hypothetical protein
MFGDGGQAFAGIERRARRIEGFVGSVVHIDQDHVYGLARRAEQPRIDVSLGYLETLVRGQCIPGRQPAPFQPGDYGFEKFEHFDPGHSIRSESGLGGVSESESAHEHRKFIARVQAKSKLRQSSLGLCVIAAHEKALIESDLGDDDSRTREQFAPTQAEFAQGRILVVKNFEKRTQRDLLLR